MQCTETTKHILEEVNIADRSTYNDIEHNSNTYVMIR